MEKSTVEDVTCQQSYKKLVNIIEVMYKKTQCAIMVNGQITEWFEVAVSVRQGCLLSPTLFNIFLDFVMMELKCLQVNTTLDKDLCMDLRYADDTTLISAVFEKLGISTKQLELACKKYGLKINADKCRIITEEEAEIEVNGGQVEKVEEFTFLGATLPGSTKDVKRRTALAYAAFGRLKANVWSKKDVSMKLKVRLYYALIMPIATYGSETWTLSKDDTRALQVFENNCLRALLNVKLEDRVTI